MKLSWCIVQWDITGRFQTYQKITAEYFVTHARSSHTSQIHCPVKFNGLRVHTASIFYSIAKFGQLPHITNIWFHLIHTCKTFIPTLYYPRIIHFIPFQLYLLSLWMHWIWGYQHTQSIIIPILNFSVQDWLIRHGPSKYLNLCLISMWMPPLKCHNCHAPCQPIL